MFRCSNCKHVKQFFEEEFWVDAGALYFFIPEDYLESPDIEPIKQKEFDTRRWPNRYNAFRPLWFPDRRDRRQCSLPCNFCAKGFSFLAWGSSFGEFWCRCRSDSEKSETNTGNNRWFYRVEITIVSNRIWTGTKSRSNLNVNVRCIWRLFVHLIPSLGIQDRSTHSRDYCIRFCSTNNIVCVLGMYIGSSM